MFSHTCSLLKLAQHFSPPLDRHMLEDFGVRYLFFAQYNCFVLSIFSFQSKWFSFLLPDAKISALNRKHLCFYPQGTESDQAARQENAASFQNYKDRGDKQVAVEEAMLPIFEFVDENVIGGKTSFEGPYGQRRGMVRGRRYF